MTDEERSKTINTRDLMNGEELEVTYFPDTGVVKINGDTVVRSTPLETDEDQTVFHRSPDNRLFTISKEDLGRLHE